ncbi:MAG TPA: helix-turn-helix domain-containing protein [Actinospica sp.]|nr:helix-turn-helix domain-containing protein [Actinospica sp.]
MRGQTDGTEPGPRTSTGDFALAGDADDDSGGGGGGGSGSGDASAAESPEPCLLTRAEITEWFARQAGEPARRIGRELARLAADGGPVDELVARLGPAGLSVLDGLRVAVLTVDGGGVAGGACGGGRGERGRPGACRALDVLSALIEEPTTASLSLAAQTTAPAPAAQLPDGRALAILADPPPRTESAVAERLAARLSLLAPSLGAEQVAVGVSDLVTAAAGLPAAVREAGHALALAAARPEPLAVAGPDDLATHRALLAHIPDELRSVYVRRLLGPLRAHDERHRTALEQTLDVFLQCSGSWSRSAARLDIHVNTLRYRIGRIAELTGRDPTELDGQTDLFLALRAR